VHAGVRAAFPGHAVKTVTEAGWRGTKDGALLELAQEHFDVFVTIDRRLALQHDLKRFWIGFVIARVKSNNWPEYTPLFERLLAAAVTVRPGEILHVTAR
jgi:hypothetical protein